MGPTPPEWDTVKLEPNSGPGRRPPPSPWPLVCLVQAPTSVAGCFPAPTSPTSQRSLSQRENGMGSSAQKSQTLGSQEASDCRGLLEGELSGRGWMGEITFHHTSF